MFIKQLIDACFLTSGAGQGTNFSDWSLEPYGLVVPSALIQCSSLVLHREVFKAGLSELYTF